ncbi:lytic transglycosylase domain-containing protein [Arachidicoccus ginsenosidivorans]|jgi:membrane-bound lytic murein transglycosylase D|uniref:Lytic transglycosylase domain-containing protein n=1 Tax=Arachidicoccus ginsenosidivorans TaxID=496057 RepID=A0A5B8VJG8_9BACT|nr:lytic transglycosylase domain-containing protein [Arachidicoccus ginsenosidivorans]QEC71135.1 lytic transglycosylase domain-containing protein [Arachidicoccus ginsenosidivorans]
MKRSLVSRIKENFLTLTGIKYLIGLVLMSGFALSMMSFTSYSGDLLPAPGKDTKLKAKGPKGFVSLLPKTKPVTLDPTTEGIKPATIDLSEVKVDLNSKVEDFADSYIRREYTDLTRMKSSAKGMFATMDRILEEYHLPTQLKYLAVIESSLKAHLRMRSGALGYWQLMPDEAVRYGLLKNGHDYRTDLARSTEAAAKLLTSLHNRYHDWLLTIAAYNAGVGGVNKAIKAAGGSKDFWKVQYYLPKETRNHVKKFISTHYFFEGSGGITTMSAKETKKLKEELAASEDGNEVIELIGNTNVVRIKGIYKKAAICKVLDIKEADFDKINPNFDKALSDGQFYDLHLPDGKTDQFMKKKDQILQQCFNDLLDTDSPASEQLPAGRTSIDRS